MKILIISYYYTPAISPRAFRWTTIAEYWAKKGEYVEVICSWEPGLARSEIINGVHIHRIGNATTKMLRKRFKNNDSIKNITLKEQGKSKNKLSLFLKWTYDHTWKKVYWPDFACSWYFSTLRKAKYLLMIGKHDRLITVSIPFTCHMVGLNIKKYNPDMLWIMDIGDPFYILDTTPVNNYKMYRRLNYLIEKKIISCADIISVTTETLAKIYRNVFPESNKKIYVIPPLISLSDKDDIENHIFPKKDMLRFVFVGTLYKAIRSPKFLLQLFRKLLQTSLGDKLEMHFFGRIHDCSDSFELYKDLPDNKIFIHGLVDHNIALQAMKEADFLVNIGNDTSYQLPSKLVEYMSSGKPIINLLSSSNDSSLLLIKDYPLHINIMNNDITEKNKVLLLEYFIKNSLGKVVNPEKVKQIINPFSEDKIIRQYTKLIYKIKVSVNNNMRVAILNLTGGGISGGYKKYLQNVIPRMAKDPTIEEILCATPPSINIREWFSFLPKVNFIACKPYNFIHYAPDQELKKALEIFSPDVIFIPVERYFKFDRVPIVNMIQNMELFAGNIDENSFINKCRLYIQRIVARRAIKKSDRVIAISGYVKEFLSYKLNILEEKIGLVYHGIELPRFKEYIRPDNIPKDWEGHFLFTAGSIRPARGLEDILGAMKYLILEKVSIKGLVIAGETELRMIKYRKKLEKWIKMNKLQSKICWAGKLSEKEISWCYRNCKIFVMTSRVESFGMIAGEAMTHGCVCISANSPCLPEIFSDAAIFYPSKRGEVLTEAIQTVFRWDSYKCKEMSERAKRQAAKFSWDITTEKLLAELKKVTKN